MKTANHDETRFELGTDQMLTIPQRPRVNITCSVGELWITEAGLGEDVVLKRGSTYASHGKGTVIAYASDPSGFDCVRIPSAIARAVDVAWTMGLPLSAMMEAPSPRIGEGGGVRRGFRRACSTLVERRPDATGCAPCKGGAQ